MINNFEWKKIITRNDTKEKFPIQSLIGKKIIGINIIGGVKPWNSEPYINCCTEAKGPIIFKFEDGSTFEIQFEDDNICCFSENQFSKFPDEIVNNQEIDANILFNEILNSKIKRIFILEEIIFVMENDFAIEISGLISEYSNYILLSKKKKPIIKSAEKMLSLRRI